jgi:V/A-type H+-transporting ATPase subunit I
MSRLLVVGAKEQMGTIVAELYRHDLFHIEDFVDQADPEYEGFKIGMPLAGATEASSELIRLRAAQNAVHIGLDEGDEVQKVSTAMIRSQIARDLPAIEEKAEGLVAKRNALDAQFKEREQRVAELIPFTNVPLDLDLYRGYTAIAPIAGYIGEDIEIPFPHEKYLTGKKGEHFIVVFVEIAHKEETERLLADAGFQPVKIPTDEGAPTEAASRYTQEITSLQSQISTIDRQVESLKAEHATFLQACDEMLSADVERAEAPLRFATTEKTFVAEGWVPSDKVDALTSGLVQVTRGSVYIEELPVDPEKDSVPVKYNNPSFAHPTELLMDVYARPDYREIDPTLMMAIVFPLFFGMILGDVGYGLILLIISYALRKVLKGEGGRQLLDVFRNSCIVSIVFGLLNSEFLGFELFWHPINFSRALQIGTTGGEGPAAVPLLVLAVWIGLIHITLGRSISIVNHGNMDHGKHRNKAIIAQTGWLTVMWGIVLMIWSMFPIPLMPDLSGLGQVLFGLNPAGLIGALMILYGIVAIGQESLLDLMELPTIISHVLSYTRLTAVGLSSVAIAMVVNYISIGLIIEPQLKSLSVVGVVLIIVGIVVFLLGHILNIALGILGGGLNSIRLHYVEFFTKFYKGGGKKYNPFGMKRRFTED